MQAAVENMVSLARVIIRLVVKFNKGGEEKNNG